MDGSKQSLSLHPVTLVCSNLDPGCPGYCQRTGHVGVGGGRHRGGHGGVLPDPGGQHAPHGPGEGTEVDTGKCVVWAASGKASHLWKCGPHFGVDWPTFQILPLCSPDNWISYPPGMLSTISRKLGIFMNLDCVI